MEAVLSFSMISQPELYIRTFTVKRNRDVGFRLAD